MEYYKFLKSNRKSDGIIYKIGLNVISEPFNFNTDIHPGSCFPYADGGLYFSDQNNIFITFDRYIYPDNLLICKVIRVDNSHFIKFNDFNMSSNIPNRTMYKTDKLIIDTMQTLEEFFLTHPDIVMSAVNQNGILLKYIKQQTEKICLAAVKSDGSALEYVKDQTKEICLEAVKNNGYALQYVKDKTYELCLEAVKNNGFALQYVKNQTYELCLEAVKNNGIALRYVKNQTKEICLAAVKNNGRALQFVRDKTSEIYTEIKIEALKQKSSAVSTINQYTLNNVYNCDCDSCIPYYH